MSTIFVLQAHVALFFVMIPPQASSLFQSQLFLGATPGVLCPGLSLDFFTLSFAAQPMYVYKAIRESAR